MILYTSSKLPLRKLGGFLIFEPILYYLHSEYYTYKNRMTDGRPYEFHLGS